MPLSIPLAAGRLAAATACSPPRCSHFGGARHSQPINPAAMKSHAISDSVTNVTMVSVRKIAHSNLSLPTVLVVSLYALIAMMPTTAAPTP